MTYVSADPALLKPSRAAAGTTFGVELFLACTSLSPPVSFALPPAVPETARLFPKLVLGTSKRFQNLAAPQRLLRKAGHANSLLWPHFCFCGLPKLLFGTPKRFQPFQPFQTLAAPQRLLLRLRESFMTFRNCCLAPQPFQPFQNLAAPQRRCSALKSLL